MESSEYNFNIMHNLQNTPQQLQEKHGPANPCFNMPPAHIMPIPSANWSLDTMPWTLASTSTGQPGGVMQFRAAQQAPLLHQKRKSEVPITESQSPKQFISEEKITAHFNGLHISSNYIQPTNDTNSMGDSETLLELPKTGKCFTNLTYQDYQVTAKELAEKLRKASRITLCKEIQQLNEEQKKVSFLPEVLVNRFSKPCTALVLWQPPTPEHGLTCKDEQQAASDNKMHKHQYYNILNIDDDDDEDDAFCENDADVDVDVDVDAEIDDYIDNNNTCNVDFNNLKVNDMDEDL